MADYLNIKAQFNAWQSHGKDRDLYRLVVAEEMKQYWKADLWTKTNIKDGSLSKADFNMLCDYAYNLFLEVDVLDIAILAATLKILLETKQVKLADIKANKKETEELILEQSRPMED